MSGLGEILRQQREIKNISLEEISQKTNISERILIALENNEYNHIPGQFYLTNFIKSYLNAIELDINAFFEKHKKSIEEIVYHNRDRPVIYYNKIRYSRFKRKNIFLGIVLIVLLSILITYFFMENRERISGMFQRTPRNIPETGVIFNYQDESINADFSPVRIQISAQSDCWLQIFQSYKKVIEQILKKGEKINIKGYEFILNIGNPSSVTIFINGRKLTRYQNQKRPQRINVSPQNLNSIILK
jgi:cytoskeletal protein RodZ